MSIRAAIQHVVRGQDGAVRPDIGVYIYVRDIAFQVNAYAAATGGSPLTQPLTPNSQGVVSAYVESPVAIDIVEAWPSGWVYRPVDHLAAAPEAWNSPTFLNSWVDFGSGYVAAGYKKATQGMIALRGLVKSGSISQPIFRLPVGYRPASALRFSVCSNNTQGQVQVEPDGDVVPVVGTNAHVSLDGIMFEAEA